MPLSQTFSKPSAKLSSTFWGKVPGLSLLFSTLNAHGISPKIVGGAVRDASLGRPIQDVDLASPASPEAVIQALEAAHLKVIPTGLKYGTVTALIDGHSFEITTLRKDTSPQGRHTDVSPTQSWEEDALRRDFTMNALYSDFDGTIYDPCQGIPDLKKGRVRFIGTPRDRIQEDHLRILRFFRFQGTHGRGTPDNDALMACFQGKSLLRALSKERIRQEFFKILMGPRPGTILRLMDQGNLFPDLFKIDSLPPLERSFLAALTKIEKALNRPDPLRRFFGFLPLDTKVLKQISGIWDFSKAEHARFLKLPHFQDPPLSLLQSLFKYDVPLTEDFMILKAAWDVCHGHPISTVLEELHPHHRTFMATPKPVLPIKGSDLGQLGVPLGPIMGQTLKQIETWWFENGCLPSKEMCLAQAPRPEKLLK